MLLLSININVSFYLSYFWRLFQMCCILLLSFIVLFIFFYFLKMFAEWSDLVTKLVNERRKT